MCHQHSEYTHLAQIWPASWRRPFPDPSICTDSDCAELPRNLVVWVDRAFCADLDHIEQGLWLEEECGSSVCSVPSKSLRKCQLSKAQSKGERKGVAPAPTIFRAGSCWQNCSETFAAGPSLFVVKLFLPPPTFLSAFSSVCELSPLINWPDYKKTTWTLEFSL